MPCSGPKARNILGKFFYTKKKAGYVAGVDYDEPTFRVQAIRELMDREGLNHTTFARRVKMSRTLLCAWFSGQVTPQVGTLGRLCGVFNVPIGFFFTTWSEGLPGQAKEST